MELERFKIKTIIILAMFGLFFCPERCRQAGFRPGGFTYYNVDGKSL
jgi:hypothetical protein